MILVCSHAGADESKDRLTGFDAYAQTALTDWKTPGIAVVVIRENKILLIKGYGVRQFGKPELVDKDTVFPIASVTKVFTATGLALLVQEGKLKWSDRVIDHLRDFQLYDPYLTKEVRLTDLVSHRTGLERADILAFRGDYDRHELIRRLQYLKPVSPFRNRFGYHNLMVVTAGEILAQASGKPWETYITERVLQPLRMDSTHMGQVDPGNNVSTGHVLIDGRLVVDPFPEKTRNDEGFRRLHRAVAPAGAIHSSIADLSKFLRMYVNEGMFGGKQFLKKKIVRDMAAPRSVLPIQTTPKPIFAYARFFVGAGLGWQLRDYRGRKIVYHTGSSGAVVALMPEEKIGVAVLANRGCGIPYMIMHDVFDRLLGIPRDVTNEDWLQDGMQTPEQATAARNAELEAKRAKDTVPSLALTKYAGTYEADLYGKLEIRLQNGALKLQFGPNMNATLKHWESDTFRGQLNFPAPGDWFLRFIIRDSDVEHVEIERIFWHESMPRFLRVNR